MNSAEVRALPAAAALGSRLSALGSRLSALGSRLSYCWCCFREDGIFTPGRDAVGEVVGDGGLDEPERVHEGASVGPYRTNILSCNSDAVCNPSRPSMQWGFGDADTSRGRGNVRHGGTCPRRRDAPMRRTGSQERKTCESGRVQKDRNIFRVLPTLGIPGTRTARVGHSKTPAPRSGPPCPDRLARPRAGSNRSTSAGLNWRNRRNSIAALDWMRQVGFDMACVCHPFNRALLAARPTAG